MKVATVSFSKREKNRFFAATITFAAALMLFVWLAFTPLQASAAPDGLQRQAISFQAVKGSDPIFLYGMSDHPGFTVGNIQKVTAQGRTQRKLNGLNEILPFGDAGSKISRMVPSPDGKLVAVEIYDDINPSTWILDLRSGHMSPVLKEGYSQLLGWHPDNRHLIVKVLDVLVPNPGLWLVDVHSGKYDRVDIPDLPSDGLLDAAVSPDGNSIAYAFTKGMGLGSELWVKNLTDGAAKQIRSDEYGMVGYILWSPDGNRIVFTTMLDSPMPFAVGGLWIVNADGSNSELLSSAIDGGHGQEPVFSADGQKLYFVERDNPKDKKANYDPAALVSSIRALDLATHQVNELVAADGATQLDISLSADGDVFFVSNRAGSSEIWTLDASGNLQQITTDGKNKSHPLVISGQ